MLEETLEKLSEKIHKLYCKQYKKDTGKDYWTKGDYSKLAEITKEYDRNIARFIFSLLKSQREELIEKAIECCGEECGDNPEIPDYIGGLNDRRQQTIDALNKLMVSKIMEMD